MAVVSLRSNKRCCRPEKVYKPARQPARALFFLVSDMEAQSFEAGARVCANRHDARHVSHQRGRTTSRYARATMPSETSRHLTWSPPAAAETPRMVRDPLGVYRGTRKFKSDYSKLGSMKQLGTFMLVLYIR